MEARRAAEKAKSDAIRQSHYQNSSLARDSDFKSESVPTGPRKMGPLNGRPADNHTPPRFSDGERNGHTYYERRDARDVSREEDISKRARAEPVADNEELATMRARYMGIAPEKTKKRRINDRKFVFDWSTDADTTTSYVDTAKPLNVAFGRGHLGGLDMGTDRRGGLDRHWSEKELIEMTERDWRIFREDFSISTKGTNNGFESLTLTGGSVPPPLRNWDEANLPPTLLQVIRDVKYTAPTPIQRQAIPIGLKCRDIIGIAETGSGKTAAFVIPILVYIQSLPPINDISRNDGPYAIVLAPTRELAQQIESEAQKFAKPMGFTVVSVVGGHTIEEQVHRLRNGAEIVIATPGRLVDCLERHVLVLSQCNYVVMDEADRMIDMGFEPDVQKVLDALPLSNLKPDTEEAENPDLMSRMLRLGKKELRYRQTVMFSATMPPELERLARKYMRRPATVIVGNAGQAVDTVEQRVIMVGPDEAKRKKKLEEVLNEQEDGPIIVFVREKRMCESLSRELQKLGVCLPYSRTFC